MVKANELRIGNMVSCTQDCQRFPCELTVKGIGWATYDYSGILEEDDFVVTASCVDNAIKSWECNLLFPIPLSPEWLERLGYKPGGDPEMYKHSCGLWVTKASGGTGYFFTGLRSGRYIKFVHELQNAVYILTGEELTLTYKK